MTQLNNEKKKFRKEKNYKDENIIQWDIFIKLYSLGKFLKEKYTIQKRINLFKKYTKQKLI